MNESDIATIPPTDEEIPVSNPSPSPSYTTDSSAAAATLTGQVEGLIRRHPMMATLATVGFGCAVGIAARALLTPQSPRHRVLRLLEDIQDRLSEFAEPAYERASDLADEGREAMKHGLDSLAESKIASRLRHLFS